MLESGVVLFDRLASRLWAAIVEKCVTPRVQKCEFRVLSVNKESRLGESMDRLGESSRDSGHMLSDQLGESEAGLGD